MALAVKETARVATERLFDAGAETLDVAVVATWQALAVRGNARCLLCGGTLVRTEDGAASCTACNSELE
jgi:hypothetical protein